MTGHMSLYTDILGSEAPLCAHLLSLLVTKEVFRSGTISSRFGQMGVHVLKYKLWGDGTRIY